MLDEDVTGFADALARSWKQITKFKPPSTHTPSAAHISTSAGAAASAAAHFATSAPTTNGPAGNPLAGDNPPMVFNLEGLIRDERGVRLAPEAED